MGTRPVSSFTFVRGRLIARREGSTVADTAVERVCECTMAKTGSHRPGRRGDMGSLAAVVVVRSKHLAFSQNTVSST